MSKPKPPTRKDFDKRFPTDDACLEHLKQVRFGPRFPCEKCGHEATYYRTKGRRSYTCEHCGHQIYPTAGTPFHASRTSLKDWFFVMFLFCASRNGVAAKEVQRQIGVTYKTAWRMCHMIRQYMGYVDGDFPVGGGGSHGAEIDETYIGGRDPKGQDDKMMVVGIIERGGDLVTRHLPTKQGWFVHMLMDYWIKPGTRIMTDRAKHFVHAPEQFDISTVNHSAKEWVRGDTHTNNIEAFWNILKRGINGTYISVSRRHLQKYLWEFEFRHNMRRAQHLMLDTLLIAFPPSPQRRATVRLP
jgi:transposase